MMAALAAWLRARLSRKKKRLIVIQWDYYQPQDITGRVGDIATQKPYDRAFKLALIAKAEFRD